MKSKEQLEAKRTKQKDYTQKWRTKNPGYKPANGYENYGGRGITVCKDWMSFDTFLKDMGKRPSKTHTLDRIDNCKGYSKKNCRWATWEEQHSNRRDNINITIKGKTQTVSQWSNELGFKRSTIYWRVKAGWRQADLFKKLWRKHD